MRTPFRPLLLSLVALLVMLAGCAPDNGPPSGTELDDPSYQRGQQLKNQGRTQEALAEYLKVIAKRGESAPESYLEAGLINLQHLKNPIAAIYYFQKYLELQPNSKKRDLVRQRIDAAMREFARTLPAQPLENVADRLELVDQVTRLQRENDLLKAELGALRGNAIIPSVRTRPDTTVAAGDSSESPLSLASPQLSEPVAESPLVAAPAVRTGSRPALNPAPTRPSAPPASSRGGRVYTVQPQDSLYSIARKNYGSTGTGAKVREIFEANRDTMKSETDIKPGMQLRLP